MTSTSPLTGLSRRMRAALVDRYWVRPKTATALVRRGLVADLDNAWAGRHTVVLTEEGERARDALLAPFVKGARVRNVLSGLVGSVVRVERADTCDTVVLLWDGPGREETCGSPVYLEVIEPANSEKLGPFDSRDETRRALLIAERERSTRQNDYTAPRHRSKLPSWLEITPRGAAQLANHLRVGLDCMSDAALRGFVEAFVDDLES